MSKVCEIKGNTAFIPSLNSMELVDLALFDISFIQSPNHPFVASRMWSIKYNFNISFTKVATQYTKHERRTLLLVNFTSALFQCISNPCNNHAPTTSSCHLACHRPTDRPQAVLAPTCHVSCIRVSTPGGVPVCSRCRRCWQMSH